MMRTLVERLAARAVRDEATGCLRWTGARSSDGYGQIRVLGVLIGVHRVAYELHVGPIPDDHDLDHVRDRGCVHRDCIEPTHLEPVTHAENVRRALFRTHCEQGHAMSGDNVKTARRAARGGREERQCKACHRAAAERRRRASATPHVDVR